MQHNLELLELIESKRLDNEAKRTFSLEYKGDKIWVKQSESAETNIWHKLSGMIASLIHSPLFIPTVATDGKSSLEGEAKRIEYYALQGVHVPHVIAKSDQWLALSDAGIPLNVFARDPKIDVDSKLKAILQSVHTIVQLHQQNLWHGRPALRDLAYDGEKVTLIDFEEDPGIILNPHECMVRDLFLFVHSLHYYLKDVPQILQEALEEIKRSERQDIWEKTVDLSKRMRLIYWVLNIIEPVAGKDARFAYRTLKFFLES